MAKEHSILRSAVESVSEAHRILERYDKRSTDFKMSLDDLHSIRSAGVMALQAAKSLTELSGYLEGKLRG